MKTLISVLISLGICAGLNAQAPQKPLKPIGPPLPGAPAPVPAEPAIKEVEGFRGANALACQAGQSIDGSNWDDQGVADAYTDYTGQRVLLSSATQALEIRFFQRGPLTNRQAASLLVKVLDMEGFVFVPSGVNEVKLLPKAQGTGSSGPAELEDIIDNPNEVPDGDDYISYFMKLGFIKPEEAVRTFTQSIHGLGPGAKIAPVPNASAVLITGKAAFVRKLINQKRYIDVPTGNVSTTWVSLKFADAEDVAATLNEIMNAQQQRKTTAGVTTAGGGSSSSNTPPVPGVPMTSASNTSSTSAGEDIPVQIVASPRLNKIFIMGRPVDIVFVEGLAREFDAPPNNNNFLKRKLRFMIASDFLDVAQNALEAASGSNTGAGQQAGGARGTRQQTTQSRSQSGQNSGSSVGGGAGAGVNSVQEFNVSDVPESIVVGKTFIVADNLANSILVQGPPESLRIVSELMDKLDGRPQQVMISTVFGEITLGKDRDVGVSLGRIATGDRHDTAGSTDTGIGALQDLAALGTVAELTVAGASGLNLYGRVKDFTGMIRALETQSNFKVLSRPTVYTANNRVAVISSGRRIAVPTNTFQSGATTGTTQSTNIEYRDVLLRFEVVPLINSDEEVTLRISLLNEDTQGSQIIDGNTIPTIVTESISTTVTVPNNSTVVLGGLVTETERNTKTGVPVLSQVPILGRLFRRDLKEIDRRELLIFIQPKIVSGELSQHSAQADMEDRYDVAPSTRDFADGVLPRKTNRAVTKKRKAKEVKKTISNSKGGMSRASKHSPLRYPTRR